jgi:hypothetical protein
MPSGTAGVWRTVYADLSHRDILQTGQVLERADDGSFGRPTVSVPKDYFAVLTENHNLIATDDPANKKVLRDLWKLTAQ